MNIYMDVDVALSGVPVNLLPLIDDTDFKTREVAIAYNQAGMDLVWNFVTTAGVYTQTAVTPTTAGVYDWTHKGDGMYSIEIPASGGGSINNDTEGFGWFSGYCTGVLPWRGPTICFRAAGINNLLIDSAYSATRGLSGTALPAADADAAGGLPISDAGGLALDTQLANTHEITAARMGALTDWIDGGRLDLLLDNIPNLTEFNARTIEAANYFAPATDTVVNVTNCANNADMVGTDDAALAATALSTATWTAAMAAVLSDWINGGRLDLILDAILADTDTTIPANQSTIITHLTDIKGSGFVGATDSNEAIRDRGDAAWITGGGGGGDATEAKQDTIITHLTDVKGSGFVGATDSNEAIRDRGDAAWTSGAGLSGSNARTINIKDQSSNNVVECAVEIWDSANTTYYERKSTDASGNTTHNMDDGTYTVRIHKAGYTFTDKTLVISGAGTTDYTGTTITIGTPAADDACRVYEYCKQQAGTTPMVNVKGTAQINTLPYDYSDSLHAGSIVDGTYDSSTGLLYWDLVIGSSVKFLIPSLGKDVICTIPDEVSARLTDL